MFYLFCVLKKWKYLFLIFLILYINIYIERVCENANDCVICACFECNGIELINALD